MSILEDVNKQWSECSHSSDWSADSYFDLVRRCKLILANRKPEDIEKIRTDAREIIKEHAEPIDEIVNDIWDKDENAVTHFSIPRILWLSIDLVDIKKRTPVHAPSWPEYLAVLALEYFQDFITALSKANQPAISNDPRHVDWPFQAMTRYAEAIEAVTLAESLVGEPDSYSLIKSELSSKLAREQRHKRQKAAHTRHEPTERLLKDLTDFYDKGSFKSYREAAHQFLEQTPQERYKHLAPTNRLRTLAEGLSAIKRGKRILKSD